MSELRTRIKAGKASSFHLKSEPSALLRYMHSTNLATAEKLVFFLNGRSEWLEKFFPLIASLDLDENVAWTTWDHRGQAGSSGHPSHIDDYDIFARDSAEMINHFAAGRPYSLVCHSMGSLIAVFATLKNYIDPESLILLSPLFGLPRKPLPHYIGRPLAKYATQLGLDRINLGFDKHLNIPFKNNRLTHDEEKYRQILDYPFRWSGPTFGWIDATFRACSFVHDEQVIKGCKASSRFSVLGGSDERVVDPKGFHSWTSACKKFKNCELEIIQTARHELHMESQELYEQAVKFIKERLQSKAA